MNTSRTITNCDKLISRFEQAITQPKKAASSIYYTGIDLGTAYIVLAVLDEEKNIVAGAYRYADVVKDGMIVDYQGAISIVCELKKEIEEKLGDKLRLASVALPPGTELLDSGVIRHVVEAAGFEVTNILDEPTAANGVLNIKNGVIVDIGGGTTGISIISNGEVIYVADEATGGTHFSLVIAGAYDFTFEQAELYKKDRENHREILPVLRPVIDKISSIIKKHIKNYQIEEIYLVGGTCCLDGIEEIITNSLGINAIKPINPMFVTPLGIALNCKQEILY